MLPHTGFITPRPFGAHPRKSVFYPSQVSLLNCMSQALIELLGSNLNYIKARRAAYFSQKEGQQRIGETWGVVITCAAGFHNIAFRKQMERCLSEW